MKRLTLKKSIKGIPAEVLDSIDKDGMRNAAIYFVDHETAAATYSAYIMQGNTQSESDCRTFQAGLINGGYTEFVDYGWKYYSATSSTIYQDRVTESEFKNAKYGTVGYYSGHGGILDGSSRYPIINYIPSNPSANFGTSSPINVATTLGISGSDWKTSCFGLQTI